MFLIWPRRSFLLMLIKIISSLGYKSCTWRKNLDIIEQPLLENTFFPPDASFFNNTTFCNCLQPTHDLPASRAPAATKVRKTISSRVHEAVKAIALVHNVTPVYESNGVTDQAEAEQHYEDTCRVYQASSPDEV